MDSRCDLEGTPSLDEIVKEAEKAVGFRITGDDAQLIKQDYEHALEKINSLDSGDVFLYREMANADIREDDDLREFTKNILGGRRMPPTPGKIPHFGIFWFFIGQKGRWPNTLRRVSTSIFKARVRSCDVDKKATILDYVLDASNWDVMFESGSPALLYSINDTRFDPPVPIVL
jgi:hypothetical protein